MHSEGAIYHVTLQSVRQRRADRSFVETGIAETDEEFQELLKASRQYDCVARAVAALLLGRYAGMSQWDIGVWLGMGTGPAVCRQLGRLRERSARHAVLKKQIGCAEAAIQAAGREAAAPEMSNIDSAGKPF